MGKMRLRILGIVPVFILFFLLTANVSAQEQKVVNEPIKEKKQVDQRNISNTDNQQKPEGNAVSGKNQVMTETNQPDAGNANNKDKSATTVKKVKSSRPNLTKSNGARPPTIVRPSGSGIPKGAGKPGGAVGPGRR